MNVLHHVDKNGLCSMRVLKFGRTLTSHNLTVFTAVIKLSAFADDVVKRPVDSSELKCEQGHEYFVNKFDFATWKPCELFLFGSGE